MLDLQAREQNYHANTLGSGETMEKLYERSLGRHQELNPLPLSGHS